MKHAYSEVRDICAIVPVLDEERLIERCLSSITSQEEISQVIVVDGGSSDRTLERAARYKVTLLEGPRGRGMQVSEGLSAAYADVILILHADCTLTGGSAERIIESLNAQGMSPGGAMGMVFDHPSCATRLVALLNNLRARLTGISFGDQGQFFRREVLSSIRGFPQIMLMEDVEFSLRLKEKGRLLFLGGGVIASGRRWKGRSFLLNLFTVLNLFTRYLIRRKSGLKGPSDTEYYRRYYGSRRP